MFNKNGGAKATSEALSGDQATKGSPKLLKAKEAAKAAYLALQEVEQDQDEDDGLSDSSIDLCAPPGAGERPKPGSWQPARLSSLANKTIASERSGSEDAPASEGEGTSEGVDGEFAGDEEAEGEEEEGEPDEALSDEGTGPLGSSPLGSFPLDRHWISRGSWDTWPTWPT